MSQPRYPVDEGSIHCPPLMLLARYQQLCTEGNVNYQKSIEFQRQPFWVRWQHRQVYRDLYSEGLRLIELKTQLEQQLAVIPLVISFHQRIKWPSGY